jgi:hypothetical protein
MNIAIYGCDPGGSTGLAWGIFSPNTDIATSLSNKLHTGSCTVTGPVREQIREITAIWQSFYRLCVEDSRLPPENVYFVMEDFVYTSANVYGGDEAKISTAIIWGIEGYRMGRLDAFLEDHVGVPNVEAIMPPMILQTAADAKSFATSLRMREWGIWVRGRDHERSAWAHVATCLQRFIRQASIDTRFGSATQ